MQLYKMWLQPIKKQQTPRQGNASRCPNGATEAVETLTSRRDRRDVRSTSTVSTSVSYQYAFIVMTSWNDMGGEGSSSSKECQHECSVGHDNNAGWSQEHCLVEWRRRDATEICAPYQPYDVLEYLDEVYFLIREDN